MAVRTRIGVDTVPLFTGERRYLVITLRDANGDLDDISGRNYKWSASSINKTNGSGLELTDPTNGELTVTLLPADLTTLLGVNDWKLERTDAGEELRPAYGTIRVDA